MTSLPPSKLIVPPSKLIVAIFASEGGYFMRGEIVFPSKLIVKKKYSPKGGFLIKGERLNYTCAAEGVCVFVMCSLESRSLAFGLA